MHLVPPQWHVSIFFSLDTWPHWDNVDFMEPITILSAVAHIGCSSWLIRWNYGGQMGCAGWRGKKRNIQQPTRNIQPKKGTRINVAGTNTDQQQNTVGTPTTWSLDIPCWLLDIETAVLKPQYCVTDYHIWSPSPFFPPWLILACSLANV